MITTLADLRADLLGVRQQGRRQSCLAFETSTAHEHHGRHAEALSVEHLFFHSVARSPAANPDRGTTMEAAAAALADEGQPFEAAWAYESVQRYAPEWAPPANVGPLHRANLRIGAISLDEICRLLDDRRAVVLGLVITDAFWAPDAHGVVQIRSPDPERGGHAVLAVGHGRDAAGELLILVRNSWGDRWGFGGHAWLSAAYLSRQLHQTALFA